MQSLKDACIRRLEALILSGEWQIGMRLPSERDLAAQLNISRPVLHDALVDLAAKGLVSIEPRRGVYVSDYRLSGSCALVSSLLAYSGGGLDPAFTQSLVDMRLLVETETAGLAAKNRTGAHLAGFEQILAEEGALWQNGANLANGALTELDFLLHLQVAVASGNLVYPLIMNSFRGVYTHLTGQFFQHYARTPVVEEVFAYHRRLVQAITAQQPEEAAALMKEMLQHGASYLHRIQSALL